jgi:mono/diheme cytochrome c family protein
MSNPRPPPASVGDPVEGLRVATRVGCNGCHLEDGRGRVFRESASEGRIVAPNLTQRRELYDDAALEALLRRGNTHDGHVPVSMPIKMLQHLSDQEIRDITAWLRSIPAVKNPDLPEGAWSATLAQQVREGTYPLLDDMLPDHGNRPAVRPPVEPLALGRHLAMTSCGECHAWDLNGWPDSPAPSLIVAKAYSAEDFHRLMKTGITATGRESASGVMTKVARKRFSVMTDAEIAALKLYLDSR